MTKINYKSQHKHKGGEHHNYVTGDLYLFHPINRWCPSQDSLWGIYDKTEDGITYLESSTLDLRHFAIRHRLPPKYRYSRLATRGELRDYMYNMGYRDAQILNQRFNMHILAITPKTELYS